MENTEITKTDVIVGVLDAVDGAMFGSLLGKVVLCFMPRSTKRVINVAVTLAFAVFSSKLAEIGYEAIYDKIHAKNEAIVGIFADDLAIFRKIRAQKKEA